MTKITAGFHHCHVYRIHTRARRIHTHTHKYIAIIIDADTGRQKHTDTGRQKHTADVDADEDTL